VSRAFVKESDGAEAPVFPEPELPPGVPNRVTPAGAAAFRARIEALRARRAGLGEGGVASAEREALGAEIKWLERRIGTFVETPWPDAPRVVGFGTAVALAGSREWTVRIVGVDEVDAAAGAISWTSPLAMALRGAAVGDVVEVVAPGGVEEWEILAISPGDAG
jgi:transcription elongation GreA/GreB family factor